MHVTPHNPTQQDSRVAPRPPRLLSGLGVQVDPTKTRGRGDHRRRHHEGLLDGGDAPDKVYFSGVGTSQQPPGWPYSPVVPGGRSAPWDLEDPSWQAGERREERGEGERGEGEQGGWDGGAGGGGPYLRLLQDRLGLGFLERDGGTLEGVSAELELGGRRKVRDAGGSYWPPQPWGRPLLRHLESSAKSRREGPRGSRPVPELTGNMIMVPAGPRIPSAPGSPGRPAGP